MTIRKFTAATIGEATEQMRNELGPDAVILNSRRIEAGSSVHFHGKEAFEITAAIDGPQPRRASPEPATRKPERAPRPTGSAPYAPPPPAEPTGADTLEHLRKMADRFEQKPRKEETDPNALLTAMGEIQQLKDDVKDIRSAIREIAMHLKYTRMPSLPDPLKRAYVTLVEQHLGEALAADIVQSVYARMRDEEFDDGEAAGQYVLSALASLVPGSGAAGIKKQGPRVVAVVGPTGVGKTTTIAKLAAIQKLVHQTEVAMVTADTYRIGAIEQLRTFASIADIPMEVVYKPSEMGTAVRKHRDKDVIFVDTVGRSQRSKKELAELAKFIGAAEPDEVHLVLNASAARSVLDDVVTRFKPVGTNRLLFSKLDEATAFGPILAVAHASRLPISFLTTGQTVPDDILSADPMKIASMVYSGVYGNA